METIGQILLRNNDLISKRIDNILNTNEFELSILFLKNIHNFLFSDILLDAGEFRIHNLTKKEYILNNESVIYSDYHNILSYLTYDITIEKDKKYKLYTPDKVSKSIAHFTSDIWQVHPFQEGNTRTVSVFIQKYLKSLNYQTKNEIFKQNYIYYRNALVKSCYYNQELGIHNDMNALIMFYNKVLFDDNIELTENVLYIDKLSNTEKVKKLLK